MSLSAPILYHHFRTPLPYLRALHLQESIYTLQRARRDTHQPYPDVLLLLEHRPVYTAGRRQTEDAALDAERTRLTRLGADFVSTARGGQLTFHGPGQLVGYPLVDLARWTPAMSIRDYICRLQRALGAHLREAHTLEPAPSDNTGVFLDARTKVASIGVQVRHRLTTHGFAMNVTDEPRTWFDEIVACGLPDVRAGSIERAMGRPTSVAAVVPGVVEQLGRELERDVRPLLQEGEEGGDGEVVKLVRDAEDDAVRVQLELGECPSAPVRR